MEKYNKYELTDSTMEHDGVTLYRIKATENGASFYKGEIGGWVEGRHNLSSLGDCWIANEAKVYGHAVVGGDARVTGFAEISGDAYVRGNCIISDGAKIKENAHVYGDARIRDQAHVYEDAHVGGQANIGDAAEILGDASVRGEAIVVDFAKISGGVIDGNAEIGGRAVITKIDDYITISPIGSEGGTLTAYRSVEYSNGKSIEVTRGCFRNSISKFEKRVREVHGDNRYGKAYQLATKLIRDHFINLNLEETTKENAKQ